MAKTKKEVCRCVICDRHSDHKGGRHLRYIYDIVDKDYHCNECEDLVKMAVKKYGPHGDLDPLLKPLPKGKDWVKEAEAFEKTLDLDWTEEDIMKIVDEESYYRPKFIEDDDDNIE